MTNNSFDLKIKNTTKFYNHYFIYFCFFFFIIIKNSITAENNILAHLILKMKNWFENLFQFSY